MSVGEFGRIARYATIRQKGASMNLNLWFKQTNSVAVTLLTLFASCISGAGVAADATGTQPSDAAKAADFPSLVRAIKGRWSVVEARDNNVGASKTPPQGEQIWRLGLGGSVLMEEEQIPSEHGVQYVLALHWWDNETHSLKGMLCNSSGSGACNVDSYYRSKLSWDGKQLTVNLVFSQGQKMMLWHEVYKDFTPNSFNQTGDIGEVGGPLQRVINMHATRVGTD
jgi:hypothetical protein